MAERAGIVSHPMLPGIPGARDFKGHGFHNSGWDYDYPKADTTGNLTGLAEKRVAIIGTGASAVQAIPYLGEWCKHVHGCAGRDWLGVLADKAIKDDTLLRECTPGYYNNEGKDQRHSIWLSNYGGGPFEYMQVLRDWIGSDAAVARDLTLTPAK